MRIKGKKCYCKTHFYFMVPNKRSQDHQKSPDHPLVAADTAKLQTQATIMSILPDFQLHSQSIPVRF